MTIATLVYALVFGSLVAVAAAALDACLRLGKGATRGVWIAALAVTVAGTAWAPERAVSPSLPIAVSIATPGVVPKAPSLADRAVQSLVTVRSLALRLAPWRAFPRRAFVHSSGGSPRGGSPSPSSCSRCCSPCTRIFGARAARGRSRQWTVRACAWLRAQGRRSSVSLTPRSSCPNGS